MPNPACVAYEAYRTSLNRTAASSVYYCSWDTLSEREKKAWWEVVQALFTSVEAPSIQPDST